ncbi:MAG: hypothetical protein MUF37_01070 [Methanoregulaceae archaeon]|nr:hypothetical protein [Methanoregulaceae archaeon]
MAGAGISKEIRWTGKQWLCEPFIIELFFGKGKNRIPVDIDPESVVISDTKDWLEIGNEGKLIKGEGKVWKVPIKVKDSKTKEIIPPGAVRTKYTPPVVVIGKIPDIKKFPPPIKQLSTTLTVVADAKDTRSAGADAIASAAVAGAGLPPGLGKTVSGTMRKISAGPPVDYIVKPPTPLWDLEQEEPLPLCGTLSGKTPEQKLKLKLDPLPEGWSNNLKINIALPDEASKNLGLLLVHEPEKTPDTTNEGIPETISVNLKLSNSICSMKKVREISKGQRPFYLPLYVSSRNEYVGGPYQELSVDLLPMEICLYINEVPEGDFKWDDDNPVRVIRKGTTGIPKKSQIPLSLHHSLECIPGVNWTFNEKSDLDDKFSDPSDPKTRYIAPSDEIWSEENKPKKRPFLCIVGEGKKEKKVAKVKEELYTTAVLKSKIELKGPLGIALVRIKISPSNLPKKEENKLDLVSTDILDLFHRKFILKVDLQKVMDTKEVAQGYGGDHDA